MPAGEVLQRLVPQIHETASLVQQISAASREQDQQAEQIKLAIRQLEHVNQQNAQMADGVAALAQTLAGHADQLKDAVAFFRLEV